MRKVYLYCLLAILSVTANQSYAAVAGEITFYINRIDLVRDGTFDRLAKEFHAIYPQATVSIQGLENYETNMPKRFELRSYGDVMLVPRDMPKQLFPNYFVPLNDMLISDSIYFPKNWEYEGNQYAYTQGVSAEGLIYNKRILEEAGYKNFPNTYGGLLAAAEKIKSKGIVPIAMNIGAAWPLQQWDKSVMIIAKDGAYFEKMVKDPQPFSPGKPFYESLKVAHKLFSAGYSEQDFIQNKWETSKQEFLNGKIAMFYLGTWFIPQAIAAGVPSEDVGFVPFPFDDSGKLRSVLNFDWGLAVSRYSKNQETAKAWIRYLISKSNYADIGGFIPTDRSRQSNLPQLIQFMSTNPEIYQAAPVTNEFIRMANRAGMDFMAGAYTRNILMSPDFEGTMAYWNKRWQRAKEN